MSAAKRPSAGEPQPDPRDETRARDPESALPPEAASPPVADEIEAAASDDPDAVLVHQHTPVASVDELRAAMQWAFENEDIAPAVLDQFAQHARLVLSGNQR